MAGAVRRFTVATLGKPRGIDVNHHLMAGGRRGAGGATGERGLGEVGEALVVGRAPVGGPGALIPRYRGTAECGFRDLCALAGVALPMVIIDLALIVVLSLARGSRRLEAPLV